MTVNGVRLHYVIGGQGDPIVLLHGYPETWYGESSIPIDGDYTKKTVAGDIHKLVQNLGLKRVFLAAQDRGAPVAPD